MRRMRANVTSVLSLRAGARGRLAALAGLLLAVLAAAPAGAGQVPHAAAEAAADAGASDVPARLQALLARPGTAWPDRVAPPAVARAYRAAGFRPLWLADGPGSARALVARLRQAGREGLRPADYDAGRLAAALRALPADRAAAVARLDLRLTAAFLSYAGDLRYGRDGLRPARFPDRADDAAGLLAGVRAASAVGVYLDSLAPRHAGYRALARALRRHLAIQAAGGWPAVPDGPALQAGDAGARVAILHRRLAAGGDLAGYDPRPEVFDDALAAAVRRFQARHGLVPDGVVAGRTLAALNVPAGRRAAQIARNLERLRWDRPPEGSSVRVNVPGFRMTLLSDGAPILHARAVVGMAERPTPLFADAISYLEFNPTWTVPPSIARADLLPRIRRDPDYLRRAGMQVYAGWSPGAPALHPAAVGWARAGNRLDSYRLVQAPGPGNPLGRVKFMFPNAYNVYLHDTPDRHLFDHARRAYSSGCIRIDRPIALARALLARTDGWDAARIDRAIASGRTVRARLAKPVPVRLVYRTAWIGRAGTLQLRPDIYGRDAALARRIAAADGAS